MRIVACTYQEHASEILATFNDAIVNSTALYDYRPRARESMVGWFKTKEAGRYPVIGAVDQRFRELWQLSSMASVQVLHRTFGLRRRSADATPHCWIWALATPPKDARKST